MTEEVGEPEGPKPKKRAPPASPETIAETGRLYETTDLTVREISGRVGVAQSSVCRMAKNHGWRRPEADKRRKLVEALRRKVGREIAAAERAIEADGDAGASARTLASLVRTLRELAKYDEDLARSRDEGREDQNDVLADPDALRDALADRLEKLRSERDG
ncbi:MAG: hypothetical protein DI565_06230 [Ancylobacter novellus]|uniref:Uncharacterized protein n=1 Tax=Ancylobacter novellus TaxID=921 RepID=A0A2W5MHG4_ANCNO|nr:MAG: hypothetical protein DI565_06230 [Ancylobacter novellus]